MRPRAPFLVLLGCAACAGALPAAAAQVSWTPDGVRVSVAAAYQPKVVPDGSGGAYIAWLDRRSGAYVAYAQRLTAEGLFAPGWPEARPVSNGGSDRNHITMISDGAGGAFVAWDETLPFQRTNVGISHLLASGELVTLIPAGAGPVGSPGSIGPDPGPSNAADPEKRENGNQYPVLAPDGEGGALMAWQFNDWWRGAYVNAIRFAADVSRYWRAAPIPAWDAGGPVICSDGEGGAFVAAVRPTWGSTGDILAGHVTATGSLAPGWQLPLSVCAASGRQDAPAIVSDDAGGAFIVWQDPRNGSFEQVCAQHVTTDSTVGWPTDGVRLCGFATKSGVAGDNDWSRDSARYSRVVPDGAGGAIVTWTDYRDGTSFGSGNIYALRVRPDGTPSPGWRENGVPVCAAPGEQQLPTIAADGAGGAYIVWQDRRRGSDWDIYAQHLDGAGRVAEGWGRLDRLLPPGPNGFALCTAAGNQTNPVVCTDPAGGAFVAWRDGRDGGPHIYAARLSPDQSVPTLASLVSADAAPARVRLIWQLADRNASARVYRRAPGLDWWELGARVPDGSGRIEIEDRDVSPGERYGYRLGLTRRGSEEFLGEIWVDVPRAGAFALDGGRPNPAVRRLLVSFALPNAEPATLELLDASGRRVLARDVGPLGAGRHVLDLDAGGGLAPGFFWLRLRQGSHSFTTKLAIVR